jgi:hypothetical protein
VRHLFLGACLIALVGCGGGPVDVRGKVTYDGKAVENGTISFEPEKQDGPTKGQAIAKGEYLLSGPNAVPPGAKIVRIQAFGPSGRKVSAAPGSKEMVDEMKQYIPKQYNAASTLKVTVESGKTNTLDFDLKK